VLHLLVREPRGAEHQTAPETMRALAARSVDPQFHEQATTLLPREQAAPVVGQLLRQHGHDTIREIDTVAARARRAVEGRARPHIPGDVGNLHDQAEAVAVRFGEDRIVEIPRIFAVDGDQRNVPQVFTPVEGNSPGIAGLHQSVVRKCHRNVMRVDGDEADRLRVTHFAKAFDDAGGFEAEALVRQRLGQHEFAGFGTGFVTSGHRPFGLGAAVGGDDAAVGVAWAEDAEDSRWALAYPVDRAALIRAGAGGAKPCEDTIARRKAGLARAFRDHTDQRRPSVAWVPHFGPADRVAVGVGPGDQDQNGVGKPIARLEEAVAFARCFVGTRVLLEGFGHSLADQVVMLECGDDASICGFRPGIFARRCHSAMAWARRSI
jgi:hypothetical protein